MYTKNTSLETLNAIASVDLTLDQKNNIELLTEVITWLGRYPSSKSEAQWDIYEA